MCRLLSCAATIPVARRDLHPAQRPTRSAASYLWGARLLKQRIDAVLEGACCGASIVNQSASAWAAYGSMVYTSTALSEDGGSGPGYDGDYSQFQLSIAFESSTMSAITDPIGTRSVQMPLSPLSEDCRRVTTVLLHNRFRVPVLLPQSVGAPPRFSQHRIVRYGTPIAHGERVFPRPHMRAQFLLGVMQSLRELLRHV